VHVQFTQRAIIGIRNRFPDAPVVAHPECPEGVRLLADEVCSTEKMVSYCASSPAKNFIVVTESGMLHRLRREVPGKTFIPGPTETCACADCHFMKMNTLEKLYDCLLHLQPEIQIAEDVRIQAARPIHRMLEWSQ
jgi:quinolinate synthase